MKKLLSVLLALSMMFCLLAGCGGGKADNPGNTDTPGTSNTDTPNPGVWVPDDDVTIIVPFDAGGGVDLVGRALADALSKHWGVNVVVENIGGGGSLIGCTEALNRAADGYTLCMMTDSLVLTPYTTDAGITLDKYTPLARITESSPTVTINAKLPYEDIDSFIEAVKAAPGQFKLGTTGAKGVWAIFAQTFAKQYGLQFNVIPYNSGNEAQLAVAGGHLELTMQNAGEVAAQVEAGALRTLCVLGDVRDPLLPDVPTGKELGIDFSAGSFRGVMVPKGVSADVLAGLNAGIEAAVADPDFVAFMDSQGLPIIHLNPADFAEYLTTKDADFAEAAKSW